MVAGLVIGELKTSQELRALALLQLVIPNASNADWGRIREAWRVASAADYAGYVRGLVVSQVMQHPIGGMLLEVPFLLNGSAPFQQAVARALFAHALDEARQARCVIIRFWASCGDTLALLDDRRFHERWDHGLKYPVTHKHADA